MAILHLESFDALSIAAASQRYSLGGTSPAIVTGRGGIASAFQFSGTASTETMMVTIPNTTTFINGFAFTCSSGSPSGAFVDFIDASTTHINLDLVAGQISVERAGTLLALGNTVLSAGTFYFIEFECTIDNVGSFTLWINGTEETWASGSGTGVDTRNGANAYINRVRLRGPSAGGPASTFDDWYILDTSGGVNDSRWGDIRVEAILPNGNGNSSQFVGSDADSTDNYLLVDEAAADGDTTYVESDTVGNKDTYAMSDLVTTVGTVYGVQTNYYGRKTSAGARSATSVARLSSTEVDGSTVSLSDSYLYYEDVFDEKPGGGAWTISDVNSAEFGVKVVG